MADSIYHLFGREKVRNNYPYREPEDLNQIKVASNAKVIIPTCKIELDKIKGALLGRITGSMIGKPI